VLLVFPVESRLENSHNFCISRCIPFFSSTFFFMKL
jgi:hypothetical protein